MERGEVALRILKVQSELRSVGWKFWSSPVELDMEVAVSKK